MKFKIFCLSFLFLTASCKASQEEIRIYLNTSSPLEPIYIGKLSSDGSLNADYLSQLESVLHFDFSHNGSTKILPTQEIHERTLSQKSNTERFNATSWRSYGALHVLKGEIKNKALTLSVFSPQTGSLKQFPEITLSGTLGRDRFQLHRLSDAIYKTLYGQPGVASTRILYAAKQRQSNNRSDNKSDKWVSEIWSCDWDGANPKQLTREGSYSITPVLIPTSSKYANDKFLYVSYKMGQPKVFIASFNEGVGKRLIDLRGNQLLPAISPQRDKIAFISDAAGKVDGRTDLFLQEFHPERSETGKPVQLFSYPRSTQASPTFSPDGSKIAFVSDKDGAPRIYIIPATFTSKRPTPALISKRNNENSCPAWSPDGKKLAYSAKTKGTRQIWIYDFDRKEEWQLTDGPGNKENPSWAPDSKHLVFNSTDGHLSELYIVNLNQPDVVKISQGTGIKHYPAWGIR
ncbi:MAG TPA: Tol-Pal system protein TolB [Rhabdochlamydiaceae bacterium]|jgi:TolB protein|nr:Tol-Pal system protein TolB [Rhabdochlamydiaceae bacterium]